MDEKLYRDFGFDEYVKYNIEANLEYVKGIEGKKIIYIGHS